MLASQPETRVEFPEMQPERLWAVILAGGRGTRMMDWIESTRGERCPKQFCTFTGSRSMLEHTLDRARAVVAPHNTVTVITRGQARHLARALRGPLPGRLLEQPADRGTAAGVLFAVAHVMEQDADGVVLVLPADHYVRPESAFARHAAYACRVARELPESVVVLGAPPAGPETDYGWILAEPWPAGPVVDSAGAEVRRVTRFHEKPASEDAERMYEAGGLWNTLVVAAKARTLWTLAARLLPELTARFSLLRGVIRTARIGGAADPLDATIATWLYQGMEPADFSRDILQAAVDSTLVVPMQGLEWSDWGRPERVLETLERYQMLTRRSGGIHMPSPSFTPNASRNGSKLGKVPTSR